MGELKLGKYKTVMCQRMQRTGSCKFGSLCDFAHDPSEIRRNFHVQWYYPVLCGSEAAEGRGCEDGQDPHCQFAHNEMEILYHPYVYKSKMCPSYNCPDGCARENYCSFAHGVHELRRAPAPPQAQPGAAVSPASSASAPPINVQQQQQQQQQQPQQHAVPQSVAVHDKELMTVTHHLKVRMLDLVDQIAAYHSQKAASAMAGAETARLNHLLAESYDAIHMKDQQIAELTESLREANSFVRNVMQLKYLPSASKDGISYDSRNRNNRSSKLDSSSEIDQEYASNLLMRLEKVMEDLSMQNNNNNEQIPVEAE